MKSYLDDPDAIRKAATVIRGQEQGICKMRAGEPVSECWCYRTGPEGNNLPCPPVIPPPQPVVTAPISNHRLTDPTPVPYRVLP